MYNTDVVILQDGRPKSIFFAYLPTHAYIWICEFEVNHCVLRPV